MKFKLTDSENVHRFIISYIYSNKNYLDDIWDLPVPVFDVSSIGIRLLLFW